MMQIVDLTMTRDDVLKDFSHFLGTSRDDERNLVFRISNRRSQINFHFQELSFKEELMTRELRTSSRASQI